MHRTPKNIQAEPDAGHDEPDVEERQKRKEQTPDERQWFSWTASSGFTLILSTGSSSSISDMVLLSVRQLQLGESECKVQGYAAVDATKTGSLLIGFERQPGHCGEMTECVFQQQEAQKIREFNSLC